MAAAEGEKVGPEFIRKQVEEFNVGKRQLANMMGEDPENFSQEDVDVRQPLVSVPTGSSCVGMVAASGLECPTRASAALLVSACVWTRAAGPGRVLVKVGRDPPEPKGPSSKGWIQEPLRPPGASAALAWAASCRLVWPPSLALH